MHGTLKVLDPSGHTETHWNEDVPAEVEAARAVFDRMTGQGYRAFRVSKGGEPAERMREFDPHAESMIVMPQLSGG